MAFWPFSLLLSVHPELQTFMQEPQIKPDQAQTPWAEHAHRRHVKNFDQTSHFVSSVHISVFFYCKLKSENRVGRLPNSRLCSAVEHITSETFPADVLPALRYYQWWRLMPSRDKPFPFSNTIAITKLTPLPILGLPHHTLNPTLPAVFPVMISDSLPCFWNRG